MVESSNELPEEQSMEEALRLHSVEDELEFPEAHDEEGVSLEEISQSYADVIARSPETSQGQAEPIETSEDEAGFEADDEVLCPITPKSIVESVLFVGRADGQPIPAADLAAIMRGVTTEEIADIVALLNEELSAAGRAFRIFEEPAGFRLALADELGRLADRFYGPTREIRLNQSAIDCLALIAYQPGIERDELEKQRGQPSGSVLSQLVRRELIEIRRESSAEDPKKKPHYYPTAKLLELTGMSSLDDLPQVEDPNADFTQ